MGYNRNMKQVEKWEAPSIEQELAFAEWCRRHEIERFLFDGDDTLWETVPIFRKQIGECLDILARTGTLSKEEWKIKLDEINNRLFETHGVNPNRWHLVMDELEKKGLGKGVRDEAEEVLNGAYRTPPSFIEGTESGLAFIRRSGVPMGIVTHANRAWTNKKFDWLDLGRFFEPDEVYTIDENGHKTAESWATAIRYFGVKTRNCAVVGDSPRSDINPVCSLGVKQCFLVKNRYGVWSVHQQDVNEDITRVIASVNDLRGVGREIVCRNGAIF